MNDWFTIEEIDKYTTVISEYKHWEETHCYLLIGTDKALLIDTGLGVSNIKDIIDTITDLPIEVVTTHIHWDHIGGHKYFDNILVHEAEKDWLSSQFPIPLAVVKSNLLHGHCDFPRIFDIEKYQLYKGDPTRILSDNDMIDLGNRKIQVIHTPGHSPGHICFYEEEQMYLFSGDLIYEGSLDAFYPTTNPLYFMESIKKVKNLPIKRILPGHHKLNISTSLIKEIDDAFSQLFASNKLEKGSGIYEFNNFQIHI